MPEKVYSRLLNDASGDSPERKQIEMKKIRLVIAMLAATVMLSGCLGFIVGNAVDLGIEVVKVPFKVTKAAVDVITDDDDEDEKKKEKDD